MNKKRDQALSPIESTRGRGPTPSTHHQMQELWLVLAKREWTSLAVLPADRNGSVEVLARSLAEVGKNLSDLPVSAVTVRMLGPGSARALAALARHVRGGQRRLWRGNGVVDVAPDSARIPTDDEGYLELPPGQLIIGVPSVVAEPVALTVAHAADAVVLGVELGKTSMRELRRSIDLIGRERLVGCVLL